MDEPSLEEVLANNTPDIILLDLMFPDVQGFELLEKLRKVYDVGIIIMTGNEDPVDRVVGLELGADDYINKPFELRELLARVRSLHRRLSKMPIDSNPGDDNSQLFIFDGFRFEKHSKFLYSPENEFIKLTGHETRLLLMFLESHNAVLDRKTMVKQLFTREWGPEDRSIDIMVSKLRRKLGKKNIILNDRSRGYRFIPLVESR